MIKTVCIPPVLLSVSLFLPIPYHFIYFFSVCLSTVTPSANPSICLSFPTLSAYTYLCIFATDIICFRYRRFDIKEKCPGGNPSSVHRAARIRPVKDKEGILCTLGDRHDKEYPIFSVKESNGASTFCTGICNQWKPRVMMPTLSPVAALQIVITIYGDTSDDKVGIMETLAFHSPKYLHLLVWYQTQIPYTSFECKMVEHFMIHKRT